MEVVEFEGTMASWDRLLPRFADATYCHLGAWHGVVRETFGHEPHYMLAVDSEQEVQGMLPLFRVRSRLFGDYLLSMPFLSYGGPIGTSEARTLLAAAAVEKAGGLGVDLLELRSRNRVPGPLDLSERKLTVLLDLPDDPDELFETGFKAKLRSQIRRPKKEGMTERIGPDLIHPFYSVFSRTMRDLGTPVLPKAFFRRVRRGLGGEVLFCVVEWRGKPVAAGCGFLWREEFEITWAGALREHSRQAPNMLLYWSLIREAIARGAKVFNFGRCTPGSGTHRFKRQWGGRDVPLPWAQWSREGKTATPSPDSPRYRLAIRAWQRLPVFVANRLGPFLSRSLP